MRASTKATIIPALALLLFAASQDLHAATAAITRATRYQTIDGFGIYNNLEPWKVKKGLTYVDVNLDSIGWYDKLITDLGVNLQRVWVEYSIEPTKPASDPSVINLADFNVTTGDFATRLPYWQKLQNAANRAGVQLNTFASVLSPPAWMKSNSSEANGGNLLTTMYAEFARFCTAYCRLFRQNVGADLYAISLQNEPAFAEPYASAVYTPQTYRDVLKVLGPRIRAESPQTKFLGAEHMMWALGTFESVILADNTAAQYFDIVAVHDYYDGIVTTPASQLVQSWSNAATYCSTHGGKHLWMSETSGYSDLWTDTVSSGSNGGAIELAQFIYTALKYGKASAWDYYGKIQNSGVPNGAWYVHKHFYRWIRPGAVMVDCSVTGDADVFAVAFVHDSLNSFTVVALNVGTADRQLTLTGGNLPSQLEVYRSTATANCQKITTVASSSTITLPALSITTLYSGPNTATSPQARAVSVSKSPAISRTLIYTLDGRQIASSEKIARLPAGTYRSVSVDANGTIVNAHPLLVSR
jgi:glucuronoarabinoxylan endo-1,4-beta-xylanase